MQKKYLKVNLPSHSLMNKHGFSLNYEIVRNLKIKIKKNKN